MHLLHVRHIRVLVIVKTLIVIVQLVSYSLTKVVPTS